MGDLFSSMSNGGGGGGGYNSGVGDPGGFLNNFTSGFGQSRKYKTSEASPKVGAAPADNLDSLFGQVVPPSIYAGSPTASPPAVPNSHINPTGNQPLKLDLEDDDGKWGGR